MGYFRNSFLVTAVGLALGAYLGWDTTHSWTGALSTMFIVAVLATLEVSLSFDNAVVNAAVLKTMTPRWRQRFITWGIAIAVFGMRIVFPLLIVAVIARIGPLSALLMAATDPENYSRVLTSANVSVSAFGGAFLAMVGLRHFFNREKDVHWINIIERPLTWSPGFSGWSPTSRWTASRRCSKSNRQSAAKLCSPAPRPFSISKCSMQVSVSTA
jgi:uncharacterized protein